MQDTVYLGNSLMANLSVVPASNYKLLLFVDASEAPLFSIPLDLSCLCPWKALVMCLRYKLFAPVAAGWDQTPSAYQPDNSDHLQLTLIVSFGRR